MCYTCFVLALALALSSQPWPRYNKQLDLELDLVTEQLLQNTSPYKTLCIAFEYFMFIASFTMIKLT